MSLLTLGVGLETAFFDGSMATVGAGLRALYQVAEPFPHIVIDNFLPESVLDRLLAEWPVQVAEVSYNRDQERLKSQYNPEELTSPFARSLFYAFNSAPFLKFVEAVTGIPACCQTPNITAAAIMKLKGITRRSLALYYYTASAAIVDEHRYHTTNFQVRPNSTDKADDKHFLRDLLIDLTPPIAKRVFRKIARRKKGPF
jgi:hypothetical protein